MRNVSIGKSIPFDYHVISANNPPNYIYELTAKWFDESNLNDMSFQLQYAVFPRNFLRLHVIVFRCDKELTDLPIFIVVIYRHRANQAVIDRCNPWYKWSIKIQQNSLLTWEISFISDKVNPHHEGMNVWTLQTFLFVCQFTELMVTTEQNV